jgi:hypothetical protein
VGLGEGDGEGLGDGDGLGEGDGDGEREGLGEGLGVGFGLDALALGDEPEGGGGGAGDSKAISRPNVSGRITLDARDELGLDGEGESAGISENGDGEATWMAADGANEGGESAKSPSPFGEWEYTQMKRPTAKPAAPQNTRSRLLSSHIPKGSFTRLFTDGLFHSSVCRWTKVVLLGVAYPLRRKSNAGPGADLGSCPFSRDQHGRGPRGIRTPDLMAASQNPLNGVLTCGYARQR